MSFVYTLVSSSKGNCTYIGDQDSGILVDAGVGIRNFAKHLKYIDVDVSAIRGIFITHEHSDHVSGLTKIVQRNNIPVFASAQTLQELLIKQILTYDMPIYTMEDIVEIDGFVVQPIKTPHDSIDSQCYKITTHDNKSVAYFTDIGHITKSIHSSMLDSDLVLIESNYEENLLKMGGYPAFLKKRVAGKSGHLSNNDCADEIDKLFKSGVNKFILAHLSTDNNTPDLAYSNIVMRLKSIGAKEGEDYQLMVAPKVNEGNIFIL